MFATTVGKAVKMVLDVVFGAAREIAADLRPVVAEQVVQRDKENVLVFRPAGFREARNEIVKPALATLEVEREEGDVPAYQCDRECTLRSSSTSFLHAWQLARRGVYLRIQPMEPWNQKKNHAHLHVCFSCFYKSSY